MQIMKPIRYQKMDAFAVLLGQGVPRIAAYARAGYSVRSGRSKKLSERADVIARAAEVAHHRARGGSRDLSFIINRLIEFAEKAAALNTAPGYMAARAALVDAARFKGLLPADADADDEPTPRELTVEEWEAQYGMVA